MSISSIELSTRMMQNGDSLHSLRDDASMEKVAREFEAMLLTFLLKVMRESVETSGLYDGMAGKDIYSEMMDQELARGLVDRGGLGLADLIRRTLEPGTAGKPSPRANPFQSGQTPTPLQPTAGEAAGQPRESHAHTENAPLDSPYRVTSSIGWRRDPFTGDWKYHSGVDLAAPEGTMVAAVTQGKVVFSGWQRGYGNTVVIKNKNGVETRYAHLSEIGVHSGEEVSKNQAIGKVGSTGRATGPHLHLEMKKDGQLLNPIASD